MRVLIFSDIHLSAGAQLGWPDADYGSSRLRDAEGVLREIANSDVDVLVFAGDVGRTARLTPTAYRIAQRTLSTAKAQHQVFCTGNHDYAGGSEDTSLHVLAASMPNAICMDRPDLVDVGGVQIGALPWAPPTRLFGRAKHNPRRLNRVVADKLIADARRLGGQLDPARPSLLVVHWLVSSTELASGSSVIEAAEPILSVDELEASGPWNVIACGHNHRRQKVGDHTYVVGSPMRSSFGEQDLETGWLLMEDGAARWVDSDDRPLQTIDIDFTTEPVAEVRPEAIVRLRVRGTEEQIRDFDARGFVRTLYEAGAGRVVGPQVSVQRSARPRSDLTQEMAPEEALARWLGLQELADDDRQRALRMGAKIIGR